MKDLSECLGVAIIGATKDTSYNEPRGEQIAEWLERHPEVTRYAIIDDDSDMLDEQKEFFAQTSFQEGMMFHHYMRLTHILGIKDEA